MAESQARKEARLQAKKERLQAVVAEMLAAEEAEGWDDSEENIDDIENAMIEIGDAVAREFGRRKLERRLREPPQPPPCPKCGHASECTGQHERRLLTRRGEVPTCEPKYYCPKCRRNFFPSVEGLGS
jgi:hypothetical protein